jgi:general secretion pathway protein A
MDHLDVSSYNRFYAFSENPFNIASNPKFFYLTPSHSVALTSMLSGIMKRTGVISVTGEVGTGKTVLIHLLLNRLNEKVKVASIYYPSSTFAELLKNILLEFNLKVVKEDEKALRNQLREYLDKLAINETVAIIVDEAQNLQEEAIEELCGLSHIDKRVQIVFVGQPEFERKLNFQRLRQTKPEVVVKRQIVALNKEQSEKYIDHRLQRVGSKNSKIFTAKAISKIVIYSRGIPRTINIVCDNALWTGYRLSKEKVDEEIILKVIRNMERSPKDLRSRIVTAIKECRLKPMPWLSRKRANGRGGYEAHFG